MRFRFARAKMSIGRPSGNAELPYEGHEEGDNNASRE
jgi:hypothetical protein